MKSLDFVKEHYVSGAIDFRDTARLAKFIPNADLEDFGFKTEEDNRVPLEWTR